MSRLVQYGRVSCSQRYERCLPPIQQGKVYPRRGQTLIKSSNNSTHIPYPNLLVRENTPVPQHQSWFMLPPQNWLRIELFPWGFLSYFWFKDTLLSLVWSKLIAFIFQPDMAVIILSLTEEFYQVSARFLQHLAFPSGLRICHCY